MMEDRQRMIHLRDLQKLESDIAAWKMVVQLLCTRHLNYPYDPRMVPEEVARMMDEQREQQRANDQNPVA